LEDRSVGDGRRVSESMLGRLAREGGGGVDSVGSGQGPVAGPCEHGDEPWACGTMDLVSLLERQSARQ
jgi:hypothetical protein